MSNNHFPRSLRAQRREQYTIIFFSVLVRLLESYYFCYCSTVKKKKMERKRTENTNMKQL